MDLSYLGGFCIITGGMYITGLKCCECAVMLSLRAQCKWAPAVPATSKPERGGGGREGSQEQEELGRGKGRAAPLPNPNLPTEPWALPGSELGSLSEAKVL